MTARSEAGKGTRFVIELPLPSVAENESAQREESAMESFHLELSSTGEPVLVVDDDAGMCEQWRLILKGHGIETIICESYEDVVRQNIGSALTQTAIVDYHFDNSEKNGAEVVQYLQTQGFKRLVLCTAEYWKPSVQKLADDLNAKLCPKPLPKIRIRTMGYGPRTVDQKDKEGYKVLVIDDEKSIRMAWEIMQEKLHISRLHCFENFEALQAKAIDLSDIDIAFVDKNIEGSSFSGADAVKYLKSKISGKIVLASGEDEESLRQDPQFSQVDFIVNEKIPTSFRQFFS